MVQTRRSLGSTSAQPKISPDLNQISRSFVSSVSHRKTDTENSKESEDGIEEEHETTFETHNTSTTSRKSENNEAFGERNFNFGLILICIVFAIFLFWLGSIPPQNLENEKYEHFKKLAISLRKKSYNHLNSETRLILGFIAKKALISTDKSPLVVVVGGAKSNNFVRDLEQILWKVQGNHKPHNPIVITDESSRAEMHITLKKNLESQIEKNHIVRSAIITNIDHLHWDAILVLHAFSDHENYPVEKTLLFMTVSEEFENNSESASDDSCDSKLTRYLQKKWITNGGSNDNVPPIISRIGYYLCI